jgi:hypothetical protein
MTTDSSTTDLELGTTGATLGAAASAIVVAFIGVLVAAGLHVRPELRDAIVTFITVVTPVAVLVWGWLHHTRVTAAAKVRAAAVQAGLYGGVPAPAAAVRRQAPHTR